MMVNEDGGGKGSGEWSDGDAKGSDVNEGEGSDDGEGQTIVKEVMVAM